MITPQSRLDDPVVYRRADQGQQERRTDHEIIVGGSGNDIVFVVEPGGLLRQPSQEWIHRSEKEIRAESSGHARKRRRQTGDGVATDLREQHGAERNQDNVSGSDGQTGVDPSEDEGSRNQPTRHAPHEPFERRREKTAAFSHSYADHRDENRSQRGEASKVTDRLGDDILNSLAIEQIDSHDRFSGQRMSNGKSQSMSDPGK